MDASAAIAASSLTQGTEIANVHVPMRRLVVGDAMPRYLKLVYTCSALLTLGKVTAWVGSGRQTNAGLGYAPGFSVAN